MRSASTACSLQYVLCCCKFVPTELTLVHLLELGAEINSKLSWYWCVMWNKLCRQHQLQPAKHMQLVRFCQTAIHIRKLAVITFISYPNNFQFLFFLWRVRMELCIQWSNNGDDILSAWSAYISMYISRQLSKILTELISTFWALALQFYAAHILSTP